MSENRSSPWPARLCALVVAALCAASAVYWALLWQAPGASVVVPADPIVASSIAVDTQLMATRMGAGTDAMAQASETLADLQLIGVVSRGGGGGGGSAIIAVQGQPARSFRVGSRVTEQWVLESVEPRKAHLAAVAGSAVRSTLEIAIPPGR